MPQTKKNTGCLIALIVAGVILLAAIVHLIVAYYFLRAKFEIHEVEDGEVASMAAPAPEPGSSPGAP